MFNSLLFFAMTGCSGDVDNDAQMATVIDIRVTNYSEARCRRSNGTLAVMTIQNFGNDTVTVDGAALGDELQNVENVTIQFDAERDFGGVNLRSWVRRTEEPLIVTAVNENHEARIPPRGSVTLHLNVPSASNCVAVRHPVRHIRYWDDATDDYRYASP